MPVTMNIQYNKLVSDNPVDRRDLEKALRYCNHASPSTNSGKRLTMEPWYNCADTTLTATVISNHTYSVARAYSQLTSSSGDQIVVLSDDPEVNKNNYFDNYHKIFNMYPDGDGGDDDDGGDIEEIDGTADGATTVAMTDNPKENRRNYYAIYHQIFSQGSVDERPVAAEETIGLTEMHGVSKDPRPAFPAGSGAISGMLSMDPEENWRNYHSNYERMVTSMLSQLEKNEAQGVPLQSHDAEENRENYHSNYNKMVGAMMENLAKETHDKDMGHNAVTNLRREQLTHVDGSGRAVMVDVGWKQSTKRSATASGEIWLGAKAFKLVKANGIKKGDVLTVAQIAGIQAAKHTSGLIPLCHNIQLTKVDVSLELDPSTHCAIVQCTAHTTGQTGVEMEALVGVTVALLTIYDMCKAVTHDMIIRDVKLMSKSGGCRGNFSRT